MKLLRDLQMNFFKWRSGVCRSCWCTCLVSFGYHVFSWSPLAQLLVHMWAQMKVNQAPWLTPLLAWLLPVDTWVNIITNIFYKALYIYQSPPDLIVPHVYFYFFIHHHTKTTETRPYHQLQGPKRNNRWISYPNRGRNKSIVWTLVLSKLDCA